MEAELSKEVNQAIAVLRESMEAMTDEQQHEVMHLVSQGYCVHCGGRTPCFCMNDE